MSEQQPLVQTGQVVDASSDERTMAAVAHACAGIFGVALVGIAVPLLIYLAYQDRSKYVRFHALQALVFALVASVAVWLLGVATCGIGFFFAVGPMLIQLYWAYLAYEGSWKPYPFLDRVGA